MSFSLREPMHAGEFIVGDIPGGEGGVCFDSGMAASAVPLASGTLVAISTAGIVAAWDPANADAALHTLVGILYWPVVGDYTEATQGVSYLARGPARVRSKWGRLTYPGYGTTNGDGAAKTALKALGLYVVE